jgi:hypothetical protein
LGLVLKCPKCMCNKSKKLHVWDEDVHHNQGLNAGFCNHKVHVKYM